MQSQYKLRGTSASEIASDVEGAIRDGRLAPGAQLPTVRAVAEDLGLSPTTVAAAYRTLRTRGLVSAHGRRGTQVSRRPPVAVATFPVVPPGLRDLAYGNPDPELLPALGPALRRVSRGPRLYGEARNDPELLRLAARLLAADGIPTESLAVFGGALDGIERVLQAWLRPGDRVAVEDPGYAAIFDLLGALGLVAEPMAVDDCGVLPDEVARVAADGVDAVILTPRAQNPLGGAFDRARVKALKAVLARHPDVLVIEDDHAGPIAGAPALTLADQRRRWAVVRSVSKSLGPDLRLAVTAGDAATIARVEGRQQLGAGWVSHVLQGLVAALWADPATEKKLATARRTYTRRRDALVHALAARGIEAHGRSGLNVWIPVPEETRAVHAMASAGFAVRAGEAHRIRSAPAIRITIAALAPRDAGRIADVLATAFAPAGRTAPA